MIHPRNCDCEAYACQLRRKGLGFSYAATPTHRSKRPWRPHRKPSWEAGTAGERRADGSFMPYVTETGRTIPIKEWGERHKKLSEVRARQTRPAPQE